MYGQNTNPLEEIKRFFMQRSVLSTLILINIAVWVSAKVIQVIFFLYNQPDAGVADNWITHYFALPAYFPQLILMPWTLVTYMFLHLEFWHILFNLLWLFWFGRIFMEFMTGRQLLLTYLLGGMAGGLCYVASFNIFPVFHDVLQQSVALGASASVMAIVTAISFWVPNYSIQLLFIGRVRIIYLALALFIFDLFAIPGGNSGGHLAHIGGALWGFLYVVYLRKGLSLFPAGRHMGNYGKSFFSERKKENVSSRQQYHERPKTDDDYNAEKIARQKKIDQILEKISKGGYESLTKEEKDLLFRSSGKEN
jgi:membrane associated rhomboid family serine protease